MENLLLLDCSSQVEFTFDQRRIRRMTTKIAGKTMTTKIAIIAAKGKKSGPEVVEGPGESALNISVKIRKTTAVKTKNPPIKTR